MYGCIPLLGQLHNMATPAPFGGQLLRENDNSLCWICIVHNPLVASVDKPVFTELLQDCATLFVSFPLINTNQRCLYLSTDNSLVCSSGQDIHQCFCCQCRYDIAGIRFSVYGNWGYLRSLGRFRCHFCSLRGWNFTLLCGWNFTVVKVIHKQYIRLLLRHTGYTLLAHMNTKPNESLVSFCFDAINNGLAASDLNGVQEHDSRVIFAKLRSRCTFFYCTRAHTQEVAVFRRCK